MTTSQPHNHSTAANPVGRFMVVAGAVIEQKKSGKILVIQRDATLDWHPNQWEIVYGRIAQFEDVESGLRREVQEEVGITELEVVGLLNVWHVFRGSQKAENEMIGITYHCRTNENSLQLSAEHQAFEWVSPQEALTLITKEGIKRDVEVFLAKTS